MLSAHLDTVFPAGTPLNPVVDGDRLEAPGACDNGAGVAGMLAIAHALVQSRVELPAPLVFLGNVGEEGEGDLRGVRHLYSQSRSGRPHRRPHRSGRRRRRLGRHPGPGQPAATRSPITGPGGHSFTDAGTPNPIAALASALAALAETPLAEEPRTTLNLGTIHGGTSVNSIPESAQASIDFRSTSRDQLVRLEVALHRAVEDAVSTATPMQRPAPAPRTPRARWPSRSTRSATAPPRNLPADSPLLEALRAVDRHLGLRTDLRLGSTDANIPLSLGIPAFSMGAGGEGGGAHTAGRVVLRQGSRSRPAGASCC